MQENATTALHVWYSKIKASKAFKIERQEHPHQWMQSLAK